MGGIANRREPIKSRSSRDRDRVQELEGTGLEIRSLASLPVPQCPVKALSINDFRLR